MRQPLAAHAAAVCLLAIALASGVSRTHAWDWPAGPDAFRDVASAVAVQQSFGDAVRHGQLLRDPYYKGEAFWYPPLLPAILALGATIADVPVNVAAARLPAYLNLATPIAFYLLLVALFDPIVAVAGLAMLLFVQPFPYWQSATYSPWLNVGGFAQAFFFIGLLAWMRFRKHPSAARAALVGAIGGLSLLAHTASAAMLAAVVGVDLISYALERPDRSNRRLSVAIVAAILAATSLAMAAPALAVPWHYGGRMLNTRPLIWLDPGMHPDRWREFLLANVSPQLFSALVVIGVVTLVRVREWTGRRLILTWLPVSLLLFLWAGYAWQVIDWAVLTKLAIAPAHHFLGYVRAGACALAGIAVAGLARLVASPSRHLRVDVVAAALVTAVVALSAGRYAHRNDDVAAPVFGENQAATVAWIAREATTEDVFLAPENTGQSMIGAVGRRTAIIDSFFSNPYLDWDRRDRIVKTIWDSLVKTDCAQFAAQAARLDVSLILTVDGMTPSLDDGQCEVRREFLAAPFAIFRLK